MDKVRPKRERRHAGLSAYIENPAYLVQPPFACLSIACVTLPRPPSRDTM
jgi:hypothetical protein